MEKLDEEPHGVPWRAKENRRILQDNHHQLIPRLLSSQETVVRFFFKGLFKLCYTAVMQKIMPSSL